MGFTLRGGKGMIELPLNRVQSHTCPLGHPPWKPHLRDSPDLETDVERVSQALREWVWTGRLLPGEHLHQKDLAAQFKVSTSPLREALRTLEAEGLVEFLPQRGARVTRLTKAVFEEMVMELQGLLTVLLPRALERLTEASVAGLDNIFPLPARFTNDLATHNTFVESILNDGGMPAMTRRVQQLILRLIGPLAAGMGGILLPDLDRTRMAFVGACVARDHVQALQILMAFFEALSKIYFRE